MLPPEIDVEVRRGFLNTRPSFPSASQGNLETSRSSAVVQSSHSPSPQRTINILLSVILLGVVFLDYWQYSRNYHAEPDIYLNVIAGTADAPAQYRIGVLDSAHFLALHTHLPLRAWLTALDFVSAFTACFVLLLVFRRSRVYLSAGVTGRWLGELAFVALVEFNIAWLIWYQRPETLPTAALLALGVLFLSVPLGGKSIQPILAVAGILGVTVAQSFVRADVVFAFNAGVLIVCLLREHPSFVLPRRLQIGVSMLGVCAAVSIQWVLMRKVFPYATYGKTPIFQLAGNLRSYSGYPPFLTVMLPVGWAIWRVAVKKSRVPGPEVAMLIAASIFTCMWAVVGITQEVRIFLPYGLVLIPLVATLLLQMVTPAPHDSPAMLGDG